MHRLAFLVVLVLASWMLNAQPVYNSNNLPSIGTVLTARMVDTIGLNPGGAGPNQTWDFAQARILGGDVITVNYISPASSPYGSQFPDADICEHSDTVYSYYKLANGRWTRLGEESAVLQSGPWADPMDVAMVPWNYNQSFTDAAQHQMVANGQTVYRSGTIQATYDGYGTLITPNGSFPNAIRIHYVRVIRDSMPITVGPITVVTVTNIEQRIWIWYNSSGNKPLFELDSATITVDNQGPVPYSQVTTTTRAAIYDQDAAPAPPPPVQVGPANGATVEGTSVRLQWTRDQQSDQVRLQVSLSNTFANTVVDVMVSGDYYDLVDLLLNTNYNWRIATVRGGIVGGKHDESTQSESEWSATYTFRTIPPTSVEWLRSGLVLGPNPTSTVLTVHGESLRDYSSYSVTSATGHAVMTGVIPDGTNRITVDTEAMSAGRYWLSLTGSRGRTTTAFVVQR